MDQHKIDLLYKGQAIHLTALVREEDDDLVYDCYVGDVMIGTVWPLLGDDPFISWNGDIMPGDLAQLIGKEIERQDR